MRTVVSRDPQESVGSQRAPLQVAAKQGSFRLPVVGWICLAIALGLLGLGVSRRINLLILLGDVIAVMLLLNLLAAGRSLRGLHVRRRFEEWLFARTPCCVEIQLSNSSRRARFGLRIEEEGQDQAAAWLVDCLPAQHSIGWRRQVVLPRRGQYTWRAVWASSGYPFGLVERRQLLAVEETVTVLPCLGWLHRGRFLRHLREPSGQPRHHSLRPKPRPHAGAQAEFHGLRAYRSGDSPRLIHWRTSARRGELMVREFEEEPCDNLLLVVDPTLPSIPERARGRDSPSLHEQFEEMISLIASLCWEWCRRRGDRLVLAAATPEPSVLDGLTGPAHARRILECLAVLECRTGPADATVIGRLPVWRLPTALVVVVAALGRSTLAEPLRRVLGRRVHCLDATRIELFDFYVPPK
jgi:uncharacterized protein (DUF58 family)